MVPNDVIEQLYAAARRACKDDDREPPDDGRRRVFKRGWTDFAVRHRKYSDMTLSTLTWCNLGYRFGRDLGITTPEDIDEVWAYLATKYQQERR
jgi:hypothetical protein